MNFIKQKQSKNQELYSDLILLSFFSDQIDMIFFSYLLSTACVSPFFSVEIPCSQVIRDFEAEYIAVAWASELGVLVTVELLSLRL